MTCSRMSIGCCCINDIVRPVREFVSCLHVSHRSRCRSVRVVNSYMKKKKSSASYILVSDLSLEHSGSLWRSIIFPANNCALGSEQSDSAQYRRSRSEKGAVPTACRNRHASCCCKRTTICASPSISTTDAKIDRCTLRGMSGVLANIPKEQQYCCPIPFMTPQHLDHPAHKQEANS